MQLFLPVEYDVVFALFALLAFTLFVLAIVRWWQRGIATTGVGVVWFLIFVLIPVIGPIGFLVAYWLERSRGEGAASGS